MSDTAGYKSNINNYKISRLQVAENYIGEDKLIPKLLSNLRDPKTTTCSLNSSSLGAKTRGAGASTSNVSTNETPLSYL